jgi:hypothetical protein
VPIRLSRTAPRILSDAALFFQFDQRRRAGGEISVRHLDFTHDNALGKARFHHLDDVRIRQHIVRWGLRQQRKGQQES